MEDYEKHLKAFDAYLVLKNYSIATRKSYGGLLNQFFEYRVDKGLVGSFSLNQARNYLLYRYSQGRKWQTINGDYSTLQHFYTKILKLKWDVSHIPRTYHRAYEEIKEELINGRWVVHNTHLTADTKVIESYLSRYFQRVRHYGLQAGSKYSIIRANGEVAYLYPLSKSPRTNIFGYLFNCSFFF